MPDDKAKDRRLRKIYKRSLREFNKTIEEQEGGCAICKRPFPKFTAFQDHDHACCPRKLQVFCGLCNRGVLCYLCNRYAVGYLEWIRKMDIPPQKVVNYFTEWTKVITERGGYTSKEIHKKTKKK